MRRLVDTVVTRDGNCGVILFTPDPAVRLPGVVMYPDVGGTRPVFEEMAGKLAGFGYAVLLPDMYYRHGRYRPFSMPSAFTDPHELARMMNLGDSLTPDMMASDAAAYFDYLGTHAQVRGLSFGVCGYCRGGRITLTVAGRCESRVAAAASLHGSQLASDSPLSSGHQTNWSGLLLRGGVATPAPELGYLPLAIDDVRFAEYAKDRGSVGQRYLADRQAGRFGVEDFHQCGGRHLPKLNCHRDSTARCAEHGRVPVIDAP